MPSTYTIDNPTGACAHLAIFKIQTQLIRGPRLLNQNHSPTKLITTTNLKFLTQFLTFTFTSRFQITLLQSWKVDEITAVQFQSFSPTMNQVSLRHFIFNCVHFSLSNTQTEIHHTFTSSLIFPKNINKTPIHSFFTGKEVFSFSDYCLLIFDRRRMNTMGRQRPGAHHQRQYSDNFLETSSNGRWLQSTGLQHLQSSNSAAHPVQVNFLLLFIGFRLISSGSVYTIN